MHRTFGLLSITRHRHSALLRWSSGLPGHRNVKLLISPCFLQIKRHFGYRSTEGYPAPPPPRYYYNNNNSYNSNNNNNNYSNSSTERDYSSQISAALPSTGMYANDRENDYYYNNNNNNHYSNYNEPQVRP